MSHIFDALQRSESERSGIDMLALSAATELLEVTERKETAGSESVVQNETAVLSEVLAENPTVAPKQTTIQGAIEASRETEFSADVRSVDQFDQFQSLRVLVPPQSKLVSLTDQESLAAEKFRFLAVRLRQLQQNRPLKKVLVTSTIPQEGKTMAASNLSCTLARKTQQKTLLLEGDLRRPSLARLFGLGKIPGISEWLQGECGPTNCIHHLEGTGLWLLPAGATASNPLELMQSGRLSVLMDQLSTWFDWIVIDSPPVMPLADTSIWIRLADGILLVTRQGTTKKEQLQRGLEAIEPLKLLGALLNSSRDATHNYYDQYYACQQSQPPAATAHNFLDHFRTSIGRK
jgi:capsular exopolysaccharide synthesis family protein